MNLVTPKNADALKKTYTRTYMLAILLVGLTILLGGYTLDKALEKQEQQAEILNISGAQRMLSQRILALSLQARLPLSQEERAANLKRLKATYQRMLDGHTYLTSANAAGRVPADANSDLRALYGDDGKRLDIRVVSFLAAAESLIKGLEKGTPSQIDGSATFAEKVLTSLLQDLDRAVGIYETSAKSRIAKASRLHKQSVLIALILLALEAAFVFRPLAKQAAGTVEQLETVAQERSRLLSSAMQAARMGYWHYELARPEEIWFSEELGNLYGVSDNQKWYRIDEARSFLDENNRNELANAVQRVIETGESQNTTTQVVRHDGRRIDTFTLIFPTLDNEGNVFAVTGVVQDITEVIAAQKKTNETLALVKEKSRDLTEAHELGRTAMWRMPLGSQELELSQEAYALMRYDFSKSDEYKTLINDVSSKGTHLKALCVEDSYERLREAQRATLDTGESQTVDIVARRGDFSLADLSVRIKLQSNDEGVPQALFGTIQDISDRREAERQLEQLAYYDHLTGLANRALCTRRLKQLCKSANKRKNSAALVLIDLDNFKEINDGLGHHAGDEFLCEIARRINQIAGPRNFAARLGGDEFALLIESAENTNDIEEMVGNILSAVTLPVTIGSAEAGGAASAGICMIPDDTCVSEEALRFADLALYDAKNNGRNRFNFFEPAMSSRLQRRLSMSRDLKEAIGTPALQTHFQPIVSGVTGKVSGFETLMRWHHPDKGWISPAAFIPVAESSHLIGDIGEFALVDACRQASKWAREGKDFDVAVNVSAAQLWQGDLEKIVETALEMSALNPARLCIELTESVFVGESVDRIEAILKRLKARGIQLALDDFGTGYSSLGYLNNLPFDKLKIDRCFVSGADVFEERYQLLEGIVGLARGLKMEIVAEGIETADELKIVRALGCDGIQGFFYGKAEPASLAVMTANRIDDDSANPFDAAAVRNELSITQDDKSPPLSKFA